MPALCLGGDATNECGIAHGHKDDIGSGTLLQDLGSHRGSADGNEWIAGVLEQIVTVLARKGSSRLHGGGLVSNAVIHHCCAEGRDARAFYRIGVAGKENCRGELGNSRRIRDRRAVITCARRHHAGDCALRGILKERKNCAARLERCSGQLAF